MKTLDEIAIEHQTDKATVFTRTYAKPHGYTVHYERAFAPFRFESLKFLEIGVGGGESIRTWLDYFPNARVWGVDKHHSTNEWNTAGFPAHPRYKFVQGDQSCITFWACFTADQGGDWGVIMDDGSHISGHIVTTFNSLWGQLRPGGLYAIEDLNEAPEAGQWLRSLLGPIHTGNSDIDSIHFSKELAILRKKL